MRVCTLVLSFAASAVAFAPAPKSRTIVPFGRSEGGCTRLRSSSPSDSTDDPFITASTSSPSIDRLEHQKSDLVRLCTGTNKPSLEDVKRRVDELELLAEQVGMGQASSCSGLLSGEWELLFSPEDDTRSSPFFWAFRRAFPDQSDQIFGITDSIPAPIKEVGPAHQSIELETATGSDKASGTLVSRVKVATLGGLATSMMTTRCKIVALEGLDGLRLQVETTKPEDSTVLKKLGPLGNFVNENSPPFPSGEALERAMPGSSEVMMRTTYCDEGLRISRNEDRYDTDLFVWRRKTFGDDGDFEI